VALVANTGTSPHTHVNDGASRHAASTRWAGASFLPPFVLAQFPVWEARQHRATAAGLFSCQAVVRNSKLGSRCGARLVNFLPGNLLSRPWAPAVLQRAWLRPPAGASSSLERRHTTLARSLQRGSARTEIARRVCPRPRGGRPHLRLRRIRRSGTAVFLRHSLSTPSASEVSRPSSVALRLLARVPIGCLARHRIAFRPATYCCVELRARFDAFT